MKYFALEQLASGYVVYGCRQHQCAQSIYSEVFPDEDFATSGYWFWLKNQSGTGFDVKAFDKNYVYARSTEWNWTQGQFKRFVQDMPLAARCVASGEPGPEVKVQNTQFKYYANLRGLATRVRLAPLSTTLTSHYKWTSGNVGVQWVRVLHYHYNCDSKYQNCTDEEQFYLANGYGLWQ